MWCFKDKWQLHPPIESHMTNFYSNPKRIFQFSAINKFSSSHIWFPLRCNFPLGNFNCMTYRTYESVTNAVNSEVYILVQQITKNSNKKQNIFSIKTICWIIKVGINTAELHICGSDINKCNKIHRYHNIIN